MIKFTTKVGFIPSCGGRGLRGLEVSYEMLPKTDDMDLTKEVEKFFKQIEDDHPIEYLLALRAKLHLIFKGNGLEAEENAEFSEMLFEELGRRALAEQQKVALPQMRPPFTVFVGKAVNTTGSRNFYETFNNLIIQCECDKSPNFMAYTEMKNHTFSHVLFNVKDLKDLEAIKENYIDQEVIFRENAVFLSIPDDKNYAKYCEFAEKYNFRLDFALDFIIENKALCWNY